MKSILVKVFLVLLSISTFSQTNQEKAKTLYFEAEYMYNNQQFAESNAKLAQVKQLLGSNNLRIQLLIVKNTYALKNYEQTKKEIDTYLSLNPSSDETFYDVMTIKAEIEKLEKGKNYITKINEAHNNNSPYTLQIIEEYLSTNPIQNEDYESIIAIKTKILVVNGYDEILQLVESRDFSAARDKCIAYLNNNSFKQYKGWNLVNDIYKYLPTASGTFKDSRDGRIYSWIKQGNQTWMAENIHYETPNSSYSVSGYYYPWKESLYVCPSGWHLPDVNEWYELRKHVPGSDIEKYNQLVSNTEKSGERSNLTGFSATLNGVIDVGHTKLGLQGKGEYACWWTSLNENMMNANSYWFNKNNKDIIYWQVSAKTHKFQVRCVKD